MHLVGERDGKQIELLVDVKCWKKLECVQGLKKDRKENKESLPGHGGQESPLGVAGCMSVYLVQLHTCRGDAVLGV